MSTGFYSSAIQPDKKSRWTPVLSLATAWSTHTDAEDKPYYFNIKTGLSTYIKPGDKDEKPFAARPIGKDTPWIIVYTSKKHYFFFNKETNWKGWFPPEDLLRKVIWQMSEKERRDLLDPRTILQSDDEEAEEEEEDQEEESIYDDDDDDDESVFEDQEEKSPNESTEDEQSDEEYLQSSLKRQRTSEEREEVV